MKLIRVLVLAGILLALAAVPALAQEPPTFELPEELPDTAAEAVNVVVAFLTFLSGLATIYVTRWLRKLPGLDENEASKIVGLGADVVAGVTALVIGLAVAYGAMAAGFLDDNGFWQVLLYVWPIAWGMHKGKKIAKTRAVAVIEAN